MLSFVKNSKIARLATASAVLGATAALMLTGGPAEAAMHGLGRGI